MRWPKADFPVADYVAWGAERLREAGVASPEREAWLLLERASGLTQSELLSLRDGCPGSVPGGDVYEEDYIPRRVGREPLQHITGVAYFRYLELAVGPGVFIPRPETELVVQAAIDFAGQQSAPTVVDLCAGSGAIALSIAHEVPGATVHAVEIDDAAITWLRRNAEHTTVQVHHADAATALPALDGTVDVVVSNPPYVPIGVRTHVEPEVRDHDPAIALWAGDDGLCVIKAVVRRAAALLRPGGLLVVEHDDTHGEVVPRLLAAFGEWSEIEPQLDLTGRPRFATAQRTDQA
jgi:release factor glutamine methyltransferase